MDNTNPPDMKETKKETSQASYPPSSMSSTGQSGSWPPRSSCWSRSRWSFWSCRRRVSTASSLCPQRWSWGWTQQTRPPCSAASARHGQTCPCCCIARRGDPLSSSRTGNKYWRTEGNGPNGKNGTGWSGRRGKKTDPPGTLWLRLYDYWLGKKFGKAFSADAVLFFFLCYFYTIKQAKEAA